MFNYYKEPGGTMVVNGTLIWYYNICRREVWLMCRNIVPDQSDENIDYGRFMHEQWLYSRRRPCLPSAPPTKQPPPPLYPDAPRLQPG